MHGEAYACEICPGQADRGTHSGEVCGRVALVGFCMGSSWTCTHEFLQVMILPVQSKLRDSSGDHRGPDSDVPFIHVHL